MQVYVTIHSHKYGEDVAVYRTSKGAEQARIDIADENWRDAYHEKLKPDDKDRMAQMFWDYMRDYGEEWFSISVCDLQQ